MSMSECFSAGVSSTRFDEGMLSHCFGSWITGRHYAASMCWMSILFPAGLAWQRQAKGRLAWTSLSHLVDVAATSVFSSSSVKWTKRGIVDHIVSRHVVPAWLNVNTRLECSRKSSKADNDVYSLKEHHHLWDLMTSSLCSHDYSLCVLSQQDKKHFTEKVTDTQESKH